MSLNCFFLKMDEDGVVESELTNLIELTKKKRLKISAISGLRLFILADKKVFIHLRTIQ